MVSKPKPIPLAMVICDVVIDDRKTGKKSLIGMFNNINAGKFPCIHPSLNVFITFDEEKLEFQEWTGKDLNYFEEVPSVYYEIVVELYPGLLMEDEEELSDEEILSLPEKTGMFSFLNAKEEDVYSQSDGIPL